MKMRKLFAGLLATSMLAAGTSAFAATANNDGYVKADGTYSIAADLSAYGDDQMTIIIIPEAAYNAESISDADILYIDQAAANTENIFKNVGILGGTTLADGNYYVKIGGENIAADGIIVEKFTISSAPAYKLGDVDSDGAPTVDDALIVIEYTLGTKTLTDVQKLAADVDKDNAQTVDDALDIISYTLSYPSYTGGNK